MAQTTTNYGLFKPEATDTYNHLVYDNPNMDTIDAAMKDNADHSVDNASCIKSGTVHSVTRTNTSCPVFKFTATGDWNTGDTMNVDGTPVSVFLPNGTAPLTGCFVINTEVLAAISGSRVTLYCPVIPDAADVSYDPTGTTVAATNVKDAIDHLNNSVYVQYDANNSVKDMLDVKSSAFTQGVDYATAVNQTYTNTIKTVGKVAIATLTIGVRTGLTAGTSYAIFQTPATVNPIAFVGLYTVSGKNVPFSVQLAYGGLLTITPLVTLNAADTLAINLVYATV